MTPAPSLTPCKVETCDAPTRARGLCNKHYLSARRKGELKPIAKKDPQQRFWEKVEKSTEGGCWSWIRHLDAAGYGRFQIEDRFKLAHRVAWEWEKGDIPEGMSLDHICHNRARVNPGHLRLATQRMNMQNRKGARAGTMSGVRGVSWCDRSKKWAATATLGGRQKFLGYYQSVGEAETVATAYRREHMPYSVKDQIGEAA